MVAKLDFSPEALLRWYLEVGVDEAIGDEPSTAIGCPSRRPELSPIGEAAPASERDARRGRQVGGAICREYHGRAYDAAGRKRVRGLRSGRPRSKRFARPSPISSSAH